MARRLSKDRMFEEPVEELDVAPDVRHEGPWDSSEKSPGDDPDYADFGPLVVRLKVGFTIRVTQDNNDGDIGALMLVTDDSALELRAFAAAKSGGPWDEARESLVAEVERLKGQAEPVEGLFGTELRVVVPGDDGPQPSRIIGIDGPRWMLRATLLGDAGRHPTDDDLLIQALKDVIVVRGSEPRIAGEPLLLSMPDNAILTPDEE
ncbi:MAG: hypothetical protein JWP31_361 [Aeromicrobium sp.]|nr:hypothetical protein [Aeromicrobium sp.]